MADMTLTATQVASWIPLLPDGIVDDTMYRVGVVCEGKAVYTFFTAHHTPVNATFLRIRMQVRLREEQCCLCHDPLRLNTLFTRVCTTDAVALFPDCFVHTACVGDDYRLAMQRLHIGWRAAQRYACWF